MLVSLVWAALFFMAGLHWFWVFGIGGIGMGGVLLAYKFVPHVRAPHSEIHRSQRRRVASSTRSRSIPRCDSFHAGGWFGKGPGEGTVKRILPDAHTDFIFAVTGGGIRHRRLSRHRVAIFVFIVCAASRWRRATRILSAASPAAGLVMLFGIQSAINMAVNLHLMPAKGMTLPFISYGGSSLDLAGARHGLPDRRHAQAAALAEVDLPHEIAGGSRL